MTTKIISTTIPELKKELKEKRKELTRLKLEKFTGKLKNFRSIFNLRKDIARIQTKINQIPIS